MYKPISFRTKKLSLAIQVPIFTECSSTEDVLFLVRSGCFMLCRDFFPSK